MLTCIPKPCKLVGYDPLIIGANRLTPKTVGLWIPDRSIDGCDSCEKPYPRALRTHTLRLLGQKTIL